ncbi:uncharacterized protein THITE_2122954 [Thermothielavioides terrestris NRRL 8126]|uniref:Nicotinamide-nucleotide adenylyltransferase n=1 Tax=Thermothielavioides terrestris (strain ATCC 38088 / NRRL 8126) TaxID=578455 RepID=G2RGD8_THETT|nr:uncharacterized protein THITE_2122954 [Thermothielavioides terrestris NRRL 8126]AEO71023.1 hypothetical protein THITE_2122954 [Thermothielavioides terrestris NRRL 8126]
MSPPGDPSDVDERSMARWSESALSLANFFSRALSLFQSSGSNLQILCTAAPTLSRGDPPDHGQPAPLPPRSRPRSLIVLDSSFNPPTRAHLRMATSAIHQLHRERGQASDSLRMLLLLSVNNADKGAKPASFDRRLAMMWAFAGDVQHALLGGLESASGEREEQGSFGGLSIDLGLAKAPYFHEKSAALAEAEFYKGTNEGGGAGETEQVFLVGFDTLIRIFNPKYYGPLDSAAPPASAGPSPMHKALDPFFRRAKLRVTMRTGDEWGDETAQRAYLENLGKAEALSEVGGSKDWGRRIEMVEGRQVGADAISSTRARAAAKDRDAGRLDEMVTPAVRWWIEQGDIH